MRRGWVVGVTHSMFGCTRTGGGGDALWRSTDMEPLSKGEQAPCAVLEWVGCAPWGMGHIDKCRRAVMIEVG
jgi:hypothetical protein